LTERSNRNLLLAVGVLAAVLDLVTKWWVFAEISEKSHRVVLGDLLWFTPTRNPYGPWSWGQGLGFLRLALPLLSVAAVVLIGRIFWHSDPADRVKGLGLALILGGAVGNLWDRTATAFDPAFGGVRDFVLLRGVWFHPRGAFWKVWDWKWGEDVPAFNLADACITVGVVLVAWRILFEAEPRPAGERAAGEAADAKAGTAADGVRA